MPVIDSSFTTIIRDPRGERLLAYLSRRFTYHDVAEWERLLGLGRLELDGKPARGDEFPRDGMSLRFAVIGYEEPEVPLDFRILERTGELAFAHKPAGMPVHRTGRIFFQTLANKVRESLHDDAWAPLNRLDRETSGLVAFARGSEAFRAYAPAAPGARWLKLYLAVVRGAPPDLAGRIDAPLSEKEGSPIRCRMHVLAEGKPALTLYRRIAGRDGLSLLAVSPVTGRKHQIRAHLAHLGCPVLGDKIYSLDGRAYRKQLDAELDADDYRELGAKRHLLHAFCLRIGGTGTGAAPAARGCGTDTAPASAGPGDFEAWDWDVGNEFAGRFRAVEARAFCATPAFAEWLAEVEAARASWRGANGAVQSPPSGS